MFNSRAILVAGISFFAALVANATDLKQKEYEVHMIPEVVYRNLLKECYERIEQDMIADWDLRVGQFRIIPNPSKEDDLSRYEYQTEDHGPVVLFKVVLGVGSQPKFYEFWLDDEGGMAPFPRCYPMENPPTIH